MKKLSTKYVKVGQRVYSENPCYRGTIYSISANFITVRRDDGFSGNGECIGDAFYQGKAGWKCRFVEDNIGSDGTNECLYLQVKVKNLWNWFQNYCGVKRIR